MSLTFLIRSLDGQSKRKFPDMLAVEDYFGPSLKESNVSNDGVQTISPADAAAENALREYRQAAALPEPDLKGGTVFFALGQDQMDTLQRDFKQKNIVFQGKGSFFIRGEDNIRMAVAALTSTEKDQGPITHGRQDVEFTVDYDNGVAHVFDQQRTASKISDLTTRPFVSKTSATLSYHSPINEDTGSHEIRKVGLFVNDLPDVAHALSQSFKKFHQVRGFNDDEGLSIAGHNIDVDDVIIPQPAEAAEPSPDPQVEQDVRARPRM